MGKRGPKASNNIISIPKMGKKRPNPPKGMTLRAHRIWKQIVSSLMPTHFRPGDLPLFRAYCEAEALHFEASQKIREEGGVIKREVVKIDKDSGEEIVVTMGIKANPWVAIQTQTSHTMSQLATKLRLCANSRVSAKDDGKEQPQSNPARTGLLFGEDEWEPGG